MTDAREVQIREWDYDDPALLVRTMEEGRGIELEQHDGFGVMRMRIFEAGQMRRLAQFLTARADKIDAEYIQFRRHLDRKEALRKAGGQK